LPITELPMRVDPRPMVPALFDQGVLGSCTGNAMSYAMSALMMKDRGLEKMVAFSRLMLYFNARAIEGTIDEDAGATIRDVVKGSAKHGAAFEFNWPYVPSNFAEKPPHICYSQGEQFRVTRYHRIDNRNLPEILTCLADGYPVVFGIAVFGSFESVTSTGRVPMPDVDGEPFRGGHALCALGYDRSYGGQYILGPNSWGEGWGESGWFKLPFAYITNPGLAADAWTTRAGRNI
jgi:C1A family cysteine protease